MTYTIHAALDTDKCHDCGEQATIVLVADTHDSETGYSDSIALCDEHKENYLNRFDRN